MSEALAFEVLPEEVRQRIDRGESIHLIDVRQPEEHQLTAIGGSELIPMDAVPTQLNRLEELADSGTLVVFCHHGMRSATVVNWLRGQGISECQSMAGGIERWSTHVDPSVPRY